MLQTLKTEIQALSEVTEARDFQRIERGLYRSLPEEADTFVEVCDQLMRSGISLSFWIVTLWVKKRGDLFRRPYFGTYERWLVEHTDRWGLCDVLCGRVLNPMMERYPDLRRHLLKWAESPQTYVRRAAAVSLIESNRSFAVNVGFPEAGAVCDRLKHDDEIHVQKGVGWLLKYAYLAHPDETVAYLERNVDELSRTTLRYALVKMPHELRQRLMSLDRCARQRSQRGRRAPVPPPAPEEPLDPDDPETD